MSMLRLFWPAACLAALLSCSAPLAALAQDAVVRSFGAGTGPDKVGIAAGEDSDDDEMNGPQAVYAGDKGDVYLLDQLNGRVLQFDPAHPRAATRALTLPDNLQPSDLIVKKDVVYAYDGQIHALQVSGADDAPVRTLSATRSIAPPDEGTLNAFAQMGSGAAGTTSDPADLLVGPTRSLGDAKARARSHQSVETRGRGSVAVDVIPADATSVDLNVQLTGGSPVKLVVKVRNQLGSVEFLDIDARGQMFVLAENVPTTTAQPAQAFVARYTAAGVLDGVFELPLAGTAMVSRRFVAISPEGDVYFLRSRKGAVDVLGIGVRAVKNVAVIESIARPELAPSFPAILGAGVAVGPLSRQRVLQTAFAFEEVTWRLNPGAYGSDPDTACSGYDRIRRPGYLQGKVNQDVHGVPYCWGCMGTLAQVAARLQHGTLAGNVCTRNNPRTDTAGVDCSAFVSATWGLSTHFTTLAIPAIAQRLSNPWDLQPGDALDKPGSHVMLFLRFTPDRRAEVMEASTGGCNGKVCRNVYPLASLLARGFQPMRYKALTEVAADTKAP